MGAKSWPDRVKALEKKTGSLTALATKLGVSFFSVHRWKKGKHKPSPLAQRLIEKMENKK